MMLNILLDERNKSQKSNKKVFTKYNKYVIISYTIKGGLTNVYV